MRTERAAELLRAARADVGTSQDALAAAAHVARPVVAAYEDGTSRPDAAELRRLLAAADLRPSIPLAVNADDIVLAAARHHLGNVRVFGSAVRGRTSSRRSIGGLPSATASSICSPSARPSSSSDDLPSMRRVA